jgi:hypothetical protein
VPGRRLRSKTNTHLTKIAANIPQSLKEAEVEADAKESAKHAQSGPLVQEASASPKLPPPMVGQSHEAYTDLDVKEVSVTLLHFLQANLNPNFGISSLECGGGGDCLYHSIGAGLERMLREGHELHASPHVPAGVFDGQRVTIVAHLRRLSATAWKEQTDEDVINYVVCAARRADNDDWLDMWSPKSILKQLQLQFLCGAGDDDVVVKAIGPNQFGDAGDLIFVVNQTEANKQGGVQVERYVPVLQGTSVMANLREVVGEKLAACGQIHWGATEDIKHLSDKLNIGFLIFRERLGHTGSQCLVNYHACRADFPFWMCIWWHEPMHFRLASLTVERGSPPRSVLLAADVPCAIKSHWTACNPQAPFGST